MAAFSSTTVRLIFIFWLWVGVACFWGDATVLDRLDEVASWRKLLLVPMAVALFDCSRLRTLLYGVFVGTAFLFLCASYGIYFGLFNLGSLEAREVLENHSTQGTVFAIAGLTCVIYAFLLFQRESAKSACFVLVLGIAFWQNIILIGSGRTPMIALLMFAVVVPFILLTRRPALVAVGLIGLLFAGILGSPLGDAARDRVSQAYSEYETASLATGDTSSSVGMRIQMWIITWDVIRANPVWGAGSGSFKNRFSESATAYGDWIAKTSDDPHNQYLLIWGEHGLIGLFLFLVAVASVFFKGVLIHSTLNGRVSQNELEALLVVVAYFLVSSLANGHFGSFVEGRICWVVIALVLVIAAETEK